MKSEIWKSIKNYENLYEISNLGRVRSLDRIVNGYNGNKRKRGKVIKPFMRGNYLSVVLSNNGYTKQFSLHRLLCEQFTENPENKATVNHINGNKLDNSLENLEWVTQSEQMLHAIKFLGFKPKKIVYEYTNELRTIRRNARLGYITPLSVRNQIRKTLSKKVICIEDNIIFESMKDAIIYSDVPKSTFHRKLHKEEMINGKTYKWYNSQKDKNG